MANRIGCLLAFLFMASPALAQTPSPPPPAIPAYHYALSPKPSVLTPYDAPNRPHWKLAEILAAHAGQKDWDQPLIRDTAYHADYIQMAPGEKTPVTLYADTDMFWVVQAGQMRVTIEGQEPFLASKGFAVWVPYRTPFSMETVGEAPSLRFEVTHAGAQPLYPTDQTPVPIKGVSYVKIAYSGAPGPYPAGTKPYLDFQKDIIQNNGRIGGRLIPDASFLRGPSVPTPPPSDQGHFHIDYNEFWFVLEGQMTYQIEGIPVFTADQGDVVYAPHGRFHRSSYAGGGMATRLAVFPQIGMNNLDGDNPSPSQPR